jgi:hypothetical protein
MSELNETITKRFGKLFRMLGSSNEFETHAALRKMTTLLKENGLSFNDVATVIENHQGEIEEKKYSDTDAEMIYQKGMEKGRADAAREQTAPPEFYDADGQPRWYEIAVFCDNNKTQLHNDWEESFVADMPGKMMRWGSPASAKQARFLLAIFVKLGGTVDPKIMRNYAS